MILLLIFGQLDLSKLCAGPKSDAEVVFASNFWSVLICRSFRLALPKSKAEAVILLAIFGLLLANFTCNFWSA
jgi:hypothetical protein